MLKLEHNLYTIDIEYIENIDKVYLDLRLKKCEILFRFGCKMSKREIIINQYK